MSLTVDKTLVHGSAFGGVVVDVDSEEVDPPSDDAFAEVSEFVVSPLVDDVVVSPPDVVVSPPDDVPEDVSVVVSPLDVVPVEESDVVVSPPVVVLEELSEVVVSPPDVLSVDVSVELAVVVSVVVAPSSASIL